MQKSNHSVINKCKCANNDGKFVFSYLALGQVVSSEILMASESGCPIEMHRIDIEKCDDMYDKECRGDRFMPFHRAGYDIKTGQSPNRPREQVRFQKQWIRY